jgi:hypothetical protein
LEALNGATEQNLDMKGTGELPKTWEEHLCSGSLNSENLESMTEVGTFGLQRCKKNRWGATKKQAGKAMLQEEAPTWESTGSQPLPPQSRQPHNLQKPGTLGLLVRPYGQDMNLAGLVDCRWRIRGTIRALVNATGRLGSLAMSGLLRRVFGL